MPPPDPPRGSRGLPIAGTLLLGLVWCLASYALLALAAIAENVDEPPELLLWLVLGLPLVGTAALTLAAGTGGDAAGARRASLSRRSLVGGLLIACAWVVVVVTALSWMS